VRILLTGPSERDNQALSKPLGRPPLYEKIAHGI